MNELRRSEYPLPGGIDKYFDTLVLLIRRVGDAAVTMEEFQDTLEGIAPPQARKYVHGVGALGLWSNESGHFKLTGDGRHFLEKVDADPVRARRMVLDRKLAGVAGYSEILQALAASPEKGEAMNALELLEGVPWEKKGKKTKENQATFRLGWLRSLGYVDFDGLTYRLTAIGERFVGESSTDSDVEASDGTDGTAKGFKKRTEEMNRGSGPLGELAREFRKALEDRPRETATQVLDEILAVGIPAEWICQMVRARPGQRKFRDDVLRAYGYRCAVTGTDAPWALEAAHIRPHAETGTSIVCNGLALRADIHCLFDVGDLRIDPDSKHVVLSPRLRRTTYSRELREGEPIYVPVNECERPAVAALRERWTLDPTKID
jgi:hypothetical protein